MAQKGDVKRRGEGNGKGKKRRKGFGVHIESAAWSPGDSSLAAQLQEMLVDDEFRALLEGASRKTSPLHKSPATLKPLGRREKKD